MVQKLALVFLGLIAVVAIGGLILKVGNVATGQYVAVGGGRYYYGPQRAQMQPDEACIYAGFEPIYPPRIFTNEYGTVVSECKRGSGTVIVPLVQTIIVR